MILERKSRTSSGNVLAVTVITLAFVSVFVGLAVEYTNNIGRNVQRSILLRQAINIADSSTEMSFAAWREISRDKGTSYVLKKSDLDGELPTPTPGNFPGVPAYNLSNYTVRPLNSSWVALNGARAIPAKIAGQNKNDHSYYFLASADVVIPTVTSKNPTSKDSKDGNVIAQVRRVFQKETLSLWRHAIFFNDDLEMHPGPLQRVNGEVHTNANFYTAHKTLTLDGKSTYSGLWEVNYHPEDSRRNKPPPPQSPIWASNLPPANDITQQIFGVAKPDYHEIIESTKVPKTGGLDPALNAYRFESQAGVRVTIDANNAVRIYNSAGTDITNYSWGSDATLATAFKNAITTNESIIDTREAASDPAAGKVRLATLDVGAITTALNNNSISFNRVVYLVDTSINAAGKTPGNVTAKRGIRLKNGGTLPSGGLTVVSGNPIYVQGDYNTGSTPSAVPGATPTVQPASNLQPLPSPGATPPSSTVAGYERKPAAIIADAVNILSNSWTDAKAGSVPLAAPTTVNAGIISGNVPTSKGNYSGGVENFPRFHENWTKKPFTYYGSMIQLYRSTQATGIWGPGYNPPDRAWYFDTNFTTDPPPGVLTVVNYRRSRWYML